MQLSSDGNISPLCSPPGSVAIRVGGPFAGSRERSDGQLTRYRSTAFELSNKKFLPIFEHAVDIVKHGSFCVDYATSMRIYTAISV